MLAALFNKVLGWASTYRGGRMSEPMYAFLEDWFTHRLSVSAARWVAPRNHSFRGGWGVVQIQTSYVCHIIRTCNVSTYNWSSAQVLRGCLHFGRHRSGDRNQAGHREHLMNVLAMLEKNGLTVNMMTSSNENIFPVTGHLWGWWPADSPLKGQWCGALMFSLISAWTNGWANNQDAGDLMRYRAHYGVTAMNVAKSVFRMGHALSEKESRRIFSKVGEVLNCAALKSEIELRSSHWLNIVQSSCQITEPLVTPREIDVSWYRSCKGLGTTECLGLYQVSGIFYSTWLLVTKKNNNKIVLRDQRVVLEIVIFPSAWFIFEKWQRDTDNVQQCDKSPEQPLSLLHPWQRLGAVSIRKTVLPGMAIPMLKIRRPNGRLIFNMEIAIRR